MKNTLIFGSWIILTTALNAQQPAGVDPAAVAEPGVVGLSPDQTSLLLQRIAKLGEEFDHTKKEVLTSAQSRISTAAASEGAAVEFYLACFKLINLDRRPVVPGEKAPDANDTSWRENILEGMKDTNVPAALRVQLAWLALAIEAAQAEDRDPLLPRLRSLVKEALVVLQTPKEGDEEKQRRVVAVVGGRDAREQYRQGQKRGPGRGSDAEGILSQSVMGSLFARAYNLNSYVDRDATWPSSPLDFAAVYEQTLIPVARGNKKAELPALWDEYIAVMAALQRLRSEEVDFLMWGQTQGKSLQWKKNIDLLRAGVNASVASDELLKLIKENPAHPSIGAWVKELTEFAAKVKDGGIDLTAPPVQ